MKRLKRLFCRRRYKSVEVSRVEVNKEQPKKEQAMYYCNNHFILYAMKCAVVGCKEYIGEHRCCHCNKKATTKTIPLSP